MIPMDIQILFTNDIFSVNKLALWKRKVLASFIYLLQYSDLYMCLFFEFPVTLSPLMS